MSDLNKNTESPKIELIRAKIIDLEKGIQNKHVPEIAKNKMNKLIDELKQEIEKLTNKKQQKKKQIEKQVEQKNNDSDKIDTSKKVQSVSAKFDLLKISETAFIIKEKGKAKHEFELNKKSNEWHVFCLDKKELNFESIDKAIDYIVEQDKKREMDEYIRIKKDNAIKKMKR